MAGSFSMDLSRICSRYKADIKLAIRRVTMQAFYRVIMRTPVDTGRALANWSASNDGPVLYEIEAEDKDGKTTISKAKRVVDGWECTGPIFLSNSLPYILRLEHGYSQKSPVGMVKMTLADMQAWANSASNIKSR